MSWNLDSVTAQGTTILPLHVGRILLAAKWKSGQLASKLGEMRLKKKVAPSDMFL